MAKTKGTFNATKYLRRLKLKARGINPDRKFKFIRKKEVDLFGLKYAKQVTSINKTLKVN